MPDTPSLGRTLRCAGRKPAGMTVCAGDLSPVGTVPIPFACVTILAENLQVVRIKRQVWALLSWDYVINVKRDILCGRTQRLWI
jgi:hypothetical protein